MSKHSWNTELSDYDTPILGEWTVQPSSVSNWTHLWTDVNSVVTGEGWRLPLALRDLQFLVAPSCSGKTYFAASHPRFEETDSARRPSFEPLLQFYREAQRWRRHNMLWHYLLRRWIVTLDPSTIGVLCHTYADAHAIGATLDMTTVVWIPRLIWQTRVEERRVQGSVDPAMALLNRNTVRGEVARYSLKTVSSFGDLLVPASSISG
jgi:hypothetical protein